MENFWKYFFFSLHFLKQNWLGMIKQIWDIYWAIITYSASSHPVMLYVILHQKFPYTLHLSVWYVGFWLQWLSGCPCRLVASSVDQSVGCGAPSYCWASGSCTWKSLSVGMDIASMLHARGTAACGSSWCQIHHHRQVLVLLLPQVIGHQPHTGQKLQEPLPATFSPHH